MEKKQFLQLRYKIDNRLNCPSCGKKYIDFFEDTTNILNTKENIFQDYKDIELPQTGYIDFECRFCGFVTRYNLNVLLK